jgi:triosephosphate isomerase (TIM)
MKKYIVANWKSYKNAAQATAWLNHWPHDQQTRQKLAKLELVLAPTYPLLAAAALTIEERQLPLHLAVQDVSGFGTGAFTGEVAVENLAGLGVGYALVGHSERRRLLGETPQLIADKVAEALRGELRPILCVDQPDLAEQAKFLPSQLREQCIVAYEPVAAIGSGQAQNPGDLLQIRELVRQHFQNSPLLYGGSVNADNIAAYLEVCDGVLVGTASVDHQDFFDLLYAAL